MLPTSIIAQIGILQKITELQKKMQRNYKGKKIWLGSLIGLAGAFFIIVQMV